MSDRPPFRNPEHAIRYGFEREAYQVCDTESFWRDLRGGTVPLPDAGPRLSVWDKQAQGGMLLGFLEREGTRTALAVLSARYTVPATAELAKRKRLHIGQVLELVRRTHRRPLPFLTDVLQGWARLGRRCDNETWAEILNVTDRTIRFWLHGRRDRRRDQRGILGTLSTLEQEAYDALREPMIVAGLIPEE